MLDDVLRRGGVAERLRHLAALLVHHEAVRQHLVERRAAARADADEQRAVEPAAMLIAAFEIDVGRPVMILAERQHRLVARSGIEPHVEDVAFALEFGAAARRRTSCRPARTLRRAARTTRRRRRRRTPTPPCRRAPWSAPACRTSCSPSPGSARPTTRWREMHQSGRLAIMPSMRAWPHDGIQRVSRDRLERALAQVLRVHRDEPLRGREEDHRVVAAPAVRVLSARSLRDARGGRAPSAPLRSSDSRPRLSSRRTARPIR